MAGIPITDLLPKERIDAICKRTADGGAEITKLVQNALDGAANGGSAALVYVPHTTAGVTINEHADPAVGRDFERALARLVGDDWDWEHAIGLDGPAGASLPRPATATNAAAGPGSASDGTFSSL